MSSSHTEGQTMDTSDEETEIEKGSQNHSRCCSKSQGLGDTEPLSSWITVGASFFMTFGSILFHSGIGLLYTPLVEYYDSSRANVGISGFLLISVGALSAFLVSPLISKYGCRPIALIGTSLQVCGVLGCVFSQNIICFHIFYGVVAGIGYGLVYVTASIIIQQKFTRNRGIATAISCLGFSVGIALVPIMFQYFLETYGLKGTLLLQAGILAHGFIASMVMKTPTKLKSKSTISFSFVKDFVRQLTSVKLCRDVKFILYVWMAFTWYLAKYCMNAHIVGAALHAGTETKDSRYLMSIAAVGDLSGKLLSMIFLNMACVNKEVYLSSGLCCLTLSAFIVVIWEHYWIKAISMFLLGCHDGIAFTSVAIFLVNLAGLDMYPKAFTFGGLSKIPGTLIAGPLLGLLIDVTGDYSGAFLIAGCSAGMATLIGFTIAVLAYIDRRKMKRKRTLTDLGEFQPIKQPDNACGNQTDKTIEILSMTIT